MNAKLTEPQTDTTAPAAKAKTGPRKGTRGPTKAKATGAAAKTPRAPKAPTAPTRGKTRGGTKQALLIDLLSQPDGATIEEMMKATGWLSHTVRGAMAGALKKRLSMKIDSSKVEGRGRVYRIVD